MGAIPVLILCSNGCDIRWDRVIAAAIGIAIGFVAGWFTRDER